VHQGLKIKKPIPVTGPWITQHEINYVTEAVKNAWYEKHDLYHKQFESAFAEYVGRRFAIALPSCTSALHLALLNLKLDPGDEVIVPEATWIATAAPISYVGATPIFADIDPSSWCISLKSIEQHISPHTRALIVVGLYGNMPDMDSIQALASERGIVVLEDAAQAIGATYKGRPAGSFGRISTFSFHGTKTLTTGEGGMLLTDDPVIYEHTQFLRDHGRMPGEKMFWNTQIAYKYKMSSMQAALGLAQLDRLDELVTRKREIFSWYQEELYGFPGLTLNQTEPAVNNAYWMTTIIWDYGFRLGKETMIKELGSRGVTCRPFFYPLSSLPAYEKHTQAHTGHCANPVV
jgi:perosamine synthetase